MSLVEEAREVAKQHQIENARKARPKHPAGWELGLNTEKNELVGRFETPLQVGEYDDAFRALLEWWGFDPDEFAIEDDKVEVRTWDGSIGRLGGTTVHRDENGRITEYHKSDPQVARFWYYKAKVVRRRPPAEVGDLVKLIRSRKPIKTAKTKVTKDAKTFAVLNADWQLGKQDGAGTEAIIAAVTAAIPVIKARYKELMKQGYEFEQLLIANLGDLVEGCAGHYPMQTFTVELSRREQVRLARELLTQQIMAWADDFPKVVVAAVPGNHGENRNADGKTFTNLGDNDDVALVEQVAEAFELAKEAGAKRFSNVRFLIPRDELNFTLDVSGTIVGLTHGHAANTRTVTGKNLSHTKVWDWWYGQMMGRQAVADADLLISGHFHYLSLFSQGGRTALQTPALDGGSGWFEDKDGLGSMAATVTLVIGGGTDGGRLPGWEALSVTSA